MAISSLLSKLPYNEPLVRPVASVRSFNDVPLYPFVLNTGAVLPIINCRVTVALPMPKDRQKFSQIIPIGIFINRQKNRPGTHPGLLTQTIEKLTYVFKLSIEKREGLLYATII